MTSAASSGLTADRSTRTSAGPVASTSSSSAGGTSSPEAARSAIERRWPSTWSIAAASPNCRSVSINAARVSTPAASATARLVATIDVPVPPLPENTTISVARPGWARRGLTGASGAGLASDCSSALPPPGGMIPAATRIASNRATASAPSSTTAAGHRPAGAVSPDVMRSTRVAGDTVSRCAAKSSAGGSANVSWRRSTSGWRSHASSMTADGWWATPQTSTALS